ncbi:hypothetical protein CQW23_05642 [Capsicum baccatum]|uniref:Uncharacterized protein n=1 Tax=Capsicum baccatum TaxID=33114 RepID=A0A2G2XI41_CAPBA|nr:hypothetical protein CQW23_05642 [Capsicum baccatum]
MEVKGEESSAHDAMFSVPDNEGKEHNVDVEKRHAEQNLDTQGGEPVEGSNAMATPTSTEVAGENELGVAEDHITCPLTGDTMEGNSADAAHSFGSTPTVVQIMDASELKEWKKVDMSPSSPTASQVSCNSDALSESGKKLIEENEILREMIEKIITTGNEQLTAISSLSGRVKDLERRLSRKKKLKLTATLLSTKSVDRKSTLLYTLSNCYTSVY